MRDQRDPTHVYIDIMDVKTSWNIGILAAADRVEKDRRSLVKRDAPGPEPGDRYDGQAWHRRSQNGRPSVPASHPGYTSGQ